MMTPTPQNVNQQFDTDTPEAPVQTHHLPATSRAHWKNCAWAATFPGQSRTANDLKLADGSRHRLQYAVTDLMASYQVNQHLDLQLNANNIFDHYQFQAIANSVSYGGDLRRPPT